MMELATLIDLIDRGSGFLVPGPIGAAVFAIRRSESLPEEKRVAWFRQNIRYGGGQSFVDFWRGVQEKVTAMAERN